MDRLEIMRCLAEYFELFLDESEVEDLDENEKEECESDEHPDKYLNLDINSYDWQSGSSFGPGDREHNWLTLAEVVNALEDI